MRSNNGAYKHSADQRMPDVQALEVRRPRRFLPAATTGSAPVRPHSPLEPPRDPGERLSVSFRGDGASGSTSLQRITSQAIAPAIRELEARGLLDRSRHPRDGRSTVLTVTVAGRAALADREPIKWNTAPDSGTFRSRCEE